MLLLRLLITGSVLIPNLQELFNDSITQSPKALNRCTNKRKTSFWESVKSDWKGVDMISLISYN